MPDFFEDLIDLFYPDERFRFPIVDPDIFLDCRDEIRCAGKRPSSDAFPGQFTEPALDQVQPGRAGRREVKMKTRVFVQPVLDVRMRMHSVVVQDHMKIL